MLDDYARMKPLRPFNRIEQSLESVIEGTINRVFRPSVQPSEIARKLGKEMSQKQLVSIRGSIVPNAFGVTLSQQDFDSFGGSAAVIATHLEDWLNDEADRLSFVTLGPIEVGLRPDEHTRPRGIAVESAIKESDETPARTFQRLGHTEALMLHRPPLVQHAWILEVSAGPLLGIAHWLDKQESSVGRALDNDFVLDAPDVSRHHASLQVQNQTPRVIDLGSLNGTFVNRRQVYDWTQVNPGDLLTFGLVETRVYA